MACTEITIMCENTAGKNIGVTGEHGFAALVERDGEKILFDTGQGMSLQNNARALRINLAAVKKLVLSHGHFDHTGGLAQFLTLSRGVEMIAHPDVFDAKYAEIDTPGGKSRTFIGTKFSREFLEGGLECRIDFQKKLAEIYPGIFYSGEVPRRTNFEKTDARLMVRRGDVFDLDPLLDDISLLIETDKGPVVLFGCAHAGAVNILRHFAAATGHRKFHAVIGGTHLGIHGEGEQLNRTMDAFDDFGIELIAVSHCTGQKISTILARRFAERFAFANAGWKVIF